MIEIKSKQGTQIIEVTKTSAGIRIKVVEGKHHTTRAIHIFDECLPELIRALVLNRQSKHNESPLNNS